MINAIKAVGANDDYEYQRIKKELKSVGINPSGNKVVDKAKLAQAKLELVQKIEKKVQNDGESSLQVQPMQPVDDTQKSERSELEVQRLGAMTVAELNRLYFNL